MTQNYNWGDNTKMKKKTPAKKNKKDTTIDDLAVMVQKGFAETATKAEMNRGFSEVKMSMATKKDILLNKTFKELLNAGLAKVLNQDGGVKRYVLTVLPIG